ncbi:MAG TPA: low molecular weight protein-tyrosine-phosphatase [Ferruginibacter sp.]|jgi:protein-tyrosine phosphatase|nr:low molecular weight protein-tyrosine-phosphatase [Ferruginibacter sp.]HMU23800.1 low molecular weight protein-tyrosine-phosphatase [Ferruginibacter sp.]
MKILMVCLGNICRSPLAEAVLRKKVFEHGLNWVIESAGTNGYHVGETPFHLTQKVAEAHQLNISDLRARKFVPSDMEQFDKIYVMAADVLEEVQQIAGKHFIPEKVDYFLNELYPGKNADLMDPWYGGYDGFEKVYELIDQTCTAIITSYAIPLPSNQAQL